MIKILSTGTDMRLVDMGRPGYGGQAVPQSGAMDMRSALQVHAMLHQDHHAPLLELSGLGAKFHFSQPTTIALGGATGIAKISDRQHSFPSLLHMEESQILEISTLHKGFRTYLAIPGLICETWLGSVCQLLPYLNSALRRGDTLLHAPVKIQHAYCGVKIKPIDLQNKISCIPGPEYDILSDTQKKQLYQSFTISKNANTMGYRLQGKAVTTDSRTSIISSAVLPGTVQLLPDGQLVILMRDCQTTGGYPRILHIEEDGICELAQRRPGDKVVFCIQKIENNYINKL